MGPNYIYCRRIGKYLNRKVYSIDPVQYADLSTILPEPICPRSLALSERYHDYRLFMELPNPHNRRGEDWNEEAMAYIWDDLETSPDYAAWKRDLDKTESPSVSWWFLKWRSTCIWDRIIQTERYMEVERKYLQDSWTR